MKIELKEILIRDLIKNYKDKNEEGVIGYNGKLDIRPPYQREFVYKDKQREAVIETVKKGFPLNSIYWVKNEDDKYEVLDGQQRIISICQYCNGVFSVNNMYFNNLTNDIQEQILDYKLMVYICDGKDSEKLDWFKTINIAGEKLTDQELRNAVYTGSWLSDAKLHFSKINCVVYRMGGKYLNGSAIRQEYLEKALCWISDMRKDNIENYMSKHQFDKDAEELWQYFQDVINWVEKVFIVYRKEMKGLEWGLFYNKYKNNVYNSRDLEEKIKQLMEDDEVSNKKGIYEYILSKNEKYLNLRTFTNNQKIEYFEKYKILVENGDYVCKCKKCGKELKFEQCQADHIVPWCKGGKTNVDNLQFLCQRCNGEKSGK